MESKIQAKCRKYLESIGAYVVKVVVANHSGCPDLLVCYKGQFIGIEVKDYDRQPSEIQKYHLNEIRKAGGISICVHSLDEMIFKLEEAL